MIRYFTCKIWSAIAGFWACLDSWVWMFPKVRVALRGTGLGACLHLVANLSSKGLTCFLGQTCRLSNSFMWQVKSKGPSAEKGRGSVREQWPLMTSSEKCRRPHQQCRLNSSRGSHHPQGKQPENVSCACVTP